MKKIVHKVTPGGSPYGWHSYSTYLKCCRKAILTERLRTTGAIDPLGSSKALRVGTYFHLFKDSAERFKGSRFDAAAVEFSHVSGEALKIDEAERQEGQRLFTAWQAEYWDTPLGETLGTEVSVDVSELGIVDPLSVRMDRVFELSTQKECAAVERAYGVRLTPAIYVQDYKTAGRREEGETEKRFMDFAFTLYQLSAQLKYKLKYVPALICSSIYKTSTVGFEHRIIPPPNTIQITGLRDALVMAKAKRDAQDMHDYNPMECEGLFGPPCYFYTTGECRRTKER